MRAISYIGYYYVIPKKKISIFFFFCSVVSHKIVIDIRVNISSLWKYDNVQYVILILYFIAETILSWGIFWLFTHVCQIIFIIYYLRNNLGPLIKTWRPNPVLFVYNRFLHRKPMTVHSAYYVLQFPHSILLQETRVLQDYLKLLCILVLWYYLGRSLYDGQVVVLRFSKRK